MPYVERDTAGRIVALHAQANSRASEALPADDPAVLQFMGAGANPALHARLSGSDPDLARVLEDVIDLLIDKGLIQFTELPPAAQRKLLTRRSLRAGRGAAAILDEQQLV